MEEDGRFECHLPEQLPIYREQQRRKSKTGPDPVKALDAAIRQYNRCKVEVPNAKVTIDQDGLLAGKIVVEQMLGDN